MPRVGLPPHVQVPQAHVTAAATAGVVPMPSDYRSRRHSSQRPLEPAVTSHHCSWEFGKGTVTCLRHGQDALYYPANSARTLVCPVCSLSLLKCTHRSLGGQWLEQARSADSGVQTGTPGSAAPAPLCPCTVTSPLDPAACTQQDGAGDARFSALSCVPLSGAQRAAVGRALVDAHLGF